MGFSPSYIDDAQLSDILCIYECLPPWTKTMRNRLNAPYGIESLLISSVCDRIAALGVGLGGKELKPSEMLSNTFMCNDKKKNKELSHEDELVRKLKATTHE